MSKKLYVGNLSYDATETQVRDLLSEYGKIESITMINDRDSGNFRGCSAKPVGRADAAEKISGATVQAGAKVKV